MSETFQISCSLQPQGEPIGLEIWINEDLVLDRPCMTTVEEFEHQCIDLDDFQYCLKFVLKNKQSHHTVVDTNNNIVSDSTISIKNVCLDEVNVDQLLYKSAKYHHNYNGNGEDTVEKFYGTMGCNGTVTFEFQTPMYLWLLENM